jgi:beta-hydroxylase
MDHMPHPDTAFKILTAAQWAQFEADGVFHGAPVDLADGRLHGLVHKKILTYY